MEPFVQTKYILTVTPKDPSHFNKLYSICNGCEAGLIDIKVGERGWIFVKSKELNSIEPWFRLYLTVVEFAGIDDNGDIHIYTKNSKYIFNKIPY